MKKRISAILLALVASLVTMFVVTPPAHAAFNACGGTLIKSGDPIRFTNGTSTLSFGSVAVYRNSTYKNWLCVKFSTGGKTVQRYNAYTKLNLTSTGTCPVPGGYGGGFEPPYGTGYNKSYYIEPGTCVRALYGIKYGGIYYYATFMRKRI